MDANEYEKLSKKKKRDLYPGKRTVWAISPVIHRPENPKAYNRRKAQNRHHPSVSVLSFCLAVFERGHTQSLDLVREQGISSWLDNAHYS